MKKLTNYYFLFIIVVTVLEMVNDNIDLFMNLFIALLILFIMKIIINFIEKKIHPDEYNQRLKNKEMEKALLLLVKSSDMVKVSKYIKLLGNGKNLKDVFIIYKDKELCSLNEYKKNYEHQYQILLEKVYQIFNDASVQNVNQELIKQEDKNTQLFNDTILKIDNLNEDIPDEVISKALDECSFHLKKLQQLLADYPQENDKIKKLHQHYLPILLDILEQYCKISQVNGDTKQSKENLIKTIDLVNTAIQNITSSLFEKDELDMNVNMNVLEDLLKKDGLIDDQLTLSMEELYRKIK